MQDFERSAKTSLNEIVAALEAFVLTLPAEFQSPLRQLLSDLVSRLSHDFNNCLSPILGFSELLIKLPTKLDDRGQAVRYLEMINELTLKAAALIQQLRGFYTLEPGQTQAMQAVLTPVNCLKILVVDDEPLVLEMLETFLTSDGHTVVTAASGREGLNAFEASAPPANQFDLVITDWAMPGMTGGRLAQAIKQIAPGKPIIMLTGFGDLMQGVGERPEGVDIVVSKPVTIATLHEAIAKATAQ